MSLGSRTTDMLEVMVVDDTITYRMITKKVAESIPGVQVLTTASNGKLAFEKLLALAPSALPDVVLLDVEMPVLDGLSTLKKINSRFPGVAVVMISALSRSNANIIVECLNAGALDFVTKPLETCADSAKRALRKDLEPILALIIQNRGKEGASVVAAGAPSPARPVRSPVFSVRQTSSRARGVAGKAMEPPVVVDSRPERAHLSIPTLVSKPSVTPRVGSHRLFSTPSAFHPGLILIGSSTGGPAALTKVLRVLGTGEALAVPILIVQHMPPIFTASLAAQLTRASGLSVREAADDMAIAPGTVILARGGQHMTVRRVQESLVAKITDGPKVNECRPAVDVLFMSVLAEYPGHVLSIILTGMGRDGTNGVDALKRVGKTYCITQDKQSCVVYGMPRSVDERGLADESLPLDKIGPKIRELCQR